MDDDFGLSKDKRKDPKGMKDMKDMKHDKVFKDKEPKEEKNMKEKVIKSFDKPKGGKKKKKKSNELQFNNYIYKVLKQIHPNLAITKEGMQVINDIIVTSFNDIAEEAGRLMKHNRKGGIMGPKDIESATKMVFTRELGNAAIHEANGAWMMYKGAKKLEQNEMFSVMGDDEDDILDELPDDDDEEY